MFTMSHREEQKEQNRKSTSVFIRRETSDYNHLILAMMDASLR